MVTSEAFDRLVRYSLWLTAPLNLAAAAAFAFPTAGLGAVFGLPDAHLLYRLFSGGMIALFGLAYAWLAAQPVIHRPLLCVGACGKLMASVIGVALFASGNLSGVAAGLLGGDAVLALLWLVYLRQARTSDSLRLRGD